MKPREERRKVMISARLRDSAGWSDARILNVSSRGLLLHARNTPQQGSFVEVARGQHSIVARVVWVRQDRFGVRTQDALAVEAIATGEAAPATPAGAPAASGGLRRREPSSAERLERSRTWARSTEFICILVFGVGAATMVFDTVKGSLSRPLSAVAAELGDPR